MALSTQKNKVLKRVLFVALAIIVALFSLRETLVRINVVGNSMLPAFSHGTVILMQKRFFKPEIGQVYAIDRSFIPEEYHMNMSLVKRVVAGPGDVIVFDAETGEPVSKNGLGVKFTSLEGKVRSFLLESHEENSYGATLRVVPAYNDAFGIQSYRIDPGQEIKSGDQRAFLKEVLNYPFIQEQAKLQGQRFVTLTVPSEHYFVLSDNLSSNLDSRYFGFIPSDGVSHRMLRIKE